MDFFLSTIIEWNDVDHSLSDAPTVSGFMQNILKFICLRPSKVYDVHNPCRLKFLTNLRFGLNYLFAHKFNFKITYCLHGFCICLTNIECTNHCLPLYLSERQRFMVKICDTDILLPNENENYLKNLPALYLLFVLVCNTVITIFSLFYYCMYF